MELPMRFVYGDADLQSLQSLQSSQIRGVGKEKGRLGGKRRDSAKRSDGMCGWALVLAAFFVRWGAPFVGRRRLCFGLG
jgi:hypothetical protein